MKRFLLFRAIDNEYSIYDNEIGKNTMWSSLLIYDFSHDYTYDLPFANLSDYETEMKELFEREVGESVELYGGYDTLNELLESNVELCI